MTNRQQAFTQKIPTQFGSLYVHASFSNGRVTEVRFSSPGKFSDTTMGTVLDLLGEAVTSLIAHVGVTP
jgi:hypothetical protein